MASNANGVGHFTAENIVAVLRALPETDGTYAEVVKRAREYGAEISKDTLGKWVSTGHRDLKAGNAPRRSRGSPNYFDQIKAEECGAEINRIREYERALRLLELTCGCGGEKMTMPDGSLGDSCRLCHEIEEKEVQRKGSSRSTARRRD